MCRLEMKTPCKITVCVTSKWVNFKDKMYELETKMIDQPQSWALFLLFQGERAWSRG